MKIDIDKIVAISEIKEDSSKIFDMVENEGELFVFEDNKPKIVLLSLEKYEELFKSVERQVIRPSDESVESLLNKIGKKIFIDYYYDFKEELNLNEKLSMFTLASRRSRASAARRIFSRNLEIEALENIINSYRLDEDTLAKAKEILESESNLLKKRGIENLDDIEEVVRIGKKARNLIKFLIHEGMVDDDEFNLMQDEKYSKKVFNMNFPVLKEVRKDIDFKDQKKDKNGYNRYYDTILTFKGREYILCSQWVENLHREALENWAKAKITDLILKKVEAMKPGQEFKDIDLFSSYVTYLSQDFKKYIKNFIRLNIPFIKNIGLDERGRDRYIKL